MNKSLRKKAFTVVELLTTIAVIAILLGVLMPALNLVRKMAKETKQKAQINSIDIAINVYKNDDGDYPESDDPTYKYCGAHKLAEAIVGYDLLGFHPDSIFASDGLDAGGNDLYPDNPPSANIDARKGPYLQSDTTVTFALDDLFGSNPPSTNLDTERYLICDTYTFKKVNIPGSTKVIKAGTPILYYRANSQNMDHDYTNASGSRYNYEDNFMLTNLNFREDIDDHVFNGTSSEEFYIFIKDPVKSRTQPWPVRMDTFLLISAGYDGRYGTTDDICNFEPNFE